MHSMTKQQTTCGESFSNKSMSDCLNHGLCTFKHSKINKMPFYCIKEVAFKLKMNQLVKTSILFLLTLK